MPIPAPNPGEENLNQRRRREYEEGGCRACGKPRVEGHSRCASCRKAGLAYHKRKVAACLAAGLCRCGSEPVLGRKTCGSCLQRERIRQKRRYMKATGGGRCWKCKREKSDGRQLCMACAEKYREYVNTRNRRLRAEILTAYGNKCACCGEMNPVFLAIDHVNNDGNLERRGIYLTKSGGTNLYRKIKREGFPARYQLLCHNCNMGKHINGGICPHNEVSAFMAGLTFAL